MLHCNLCKQSFQPSRRAVQQGRNVVGNASEIDGICTDLFISFRPCLIRSGFQGGFCKAEKIFCHFTSTAFYISFKIYWNAVFKPAERNGIQIVRNFSSSEIPACFRNERTAEFSCIIIIISVNQGFSGCSGLAGFFFSSGKVKPIVFIKSPHQEAATEA